MMKAFQGIIGRLRTALLCTALIVLGTGVVAQTKQETGQSPAPPAEVPNAERERSRTRQIRAYEQFIRSHPRHPRCEDAFRRIVKLASAPGDYKRNLRYADLVDIDQAAYDDETGELILIGPCISDWKRGYLPPLLLVDDFAGAFKILDAKSSGLGVTLSISPGAREDSSTQATPTQFAVHYTPAWLGETHFGQVLLAADRRLKSLALGVNAQGEPMWSPVAAYRAVPGNATGNSRGAIPIMLKLSTRSAMIVFQGYSFKFVDFPMDVQPVRESESDPAIAAFAKHLNANFDEYVEEYAELKECVRLLKLLHVAKWYRASGFPDEEVLSYRPLRFEPVTVVPVLKAGTPDNKTTYYGGLQLTSRQCEARDGAPSGFTSAVLRARPEPAAVSWTVHVSGRQLVAIAIPAR